MVQGLTLPKVIRWLAVGALRNEHATNDEALLRIQRDLDLAESQLKFGSRASPRP